MTDTATTQVSIYIGAPSAFVARADRLASRLTRAAKGVEVRRSDIYRSALARGFAVLEAELGPERSAVEHPPEEGPAAA